MPAPGISNYRFGQKNNWRRRVWNEISRRVKDKKNARILYLAGEQNLDAEIASQKGFDSRNMIAVEIDKKRTDDLRRKGVTTICGDLLDVLHCWPDNHKVDVIIADFCFGFEMSSSDLYGALESPPLVDAVVLVNFQRGRDASTNVLRKFFPPKNFDSVNHKRKRIGTVTSKHRAGQFLQFQSFLDFQAVYTDWQHLKSGSLVLDNQWLEDPVFSFWVNRFYYRMRPTLLSYKSGRVFMDSAIFSHASKGISEDAREWLTKTDGWRVNVQEQNPQMKRKITAALAVQSKRKAA